MNNEINVEKSSLQAEIDELKQLLAAAMKREEEANAKAIAADQELEEKDQDYEELEKFAAERDALAKELEQKLSSVAAKPSVPGDDEMEELYKDMGLLLEEKQKIEEELNKEKSLWESREEELKRIAGEEQRLLVQEAEAKMNKLREDLSSASSELEKQKEDAQEQRKEKEHI